MTQLAPVFVQNTGSCLPNAPVDNEEIEDVLGRIGGQASRAKRRILKSNGIETRHYAIDPKTGAASHSNADLTEAAIRDAIARAGCGIDDIDLLACGTSTPDQLLPNHALMVHGKLGTRPCEVVATTGACLSGITALKYAAMSVATQSAQRAIATGSEIASAVMRASHFPHGETPVEELDAHPMAAFGQDFLRWMLSDGAGAVLLGNTPSSAGLSLRLDWTEIVSFAHEIDTCMYWGGKKQDDGSFAGWMQSESLDQAVAEGMMNVTQDVRLLGREIGRAMVCKGLNAIRERRDINATEIDWFLPHYSSEFFRGEVSGRLEEIDFAIPYERWFTNLTTRGNTGAASFYIILDELLHSGKLRPGQRILGFIPESARFSVGYVALTVVSATDSD